MRAMLAFIVFRYEMLDISIEIVERLNNCFFFEEF